MERKLAESLMQTYLAMTQPLNAAERMAREITDKAEQESARRAIGSLMQAVYVELMRPIIRQFPDLDPDREKDA
jgi:hypothetical protein